MPGGRIPDGLMGVKVKGTLAIGWRVESIVRRVVRRGTHDQIGVRVMLMTRVGVKTGVGKTIGIG